MILTTSLSLSDSRLYEAAEVLKTSKLRAFFTITIPGARYGIISTTFVISLTTIIVLAITCITMPAV